MSIVSFFKLHFVRCVYPLIFFIFYSDYLTAQCVITSTVGYTVSATIIPTTIVRPGSCASGYNYNVTFNYSITISGTNSGSNGNVGIQPQIFCNSQNNGYYTINVPAPTVGASSSTTTYTGTLTTTTNPYRSLTDCITATPSSLSCNSLQITAFGPGISTATFSCPSSALPIELLYFRAEKLNNLIKLTWSTASEENNDYFTIEKSSDASTWNAIANIKGAGSSKSILSYSYQYSEIQTGILYYRLKQTDYNKEFKYSAIISVNNHLLEDQEQQILLFPNPNNGLFTVQSSKKDIYQVAIFDSSGKQVCDFVLDKPDIDVSYLINGIYYVLFQNGSQIIVKKMMVAK